MSEETKNKKVMGPALPPGFIRNNSDTAENSTIKDELSRPKKIYGPTRPPAEKSGDAAKTRGRSRSPPASTNRESWMVQSDNRNNTIKIDPLNIKSRRFRQRPSNSKIYENSTEELDVETRIKEKDTDAQIEEYNSIYRKKTLQKIHEENHMDKKKAQTAADRQERIFDWERDMNSSVRQMSTKSAKELVQKSTLNDRFGSSSSKKYL